jgi:hypothetical protein
LSVEFCGWWRLAIRVDLLMDPFSQLKPPPARQTNATSHRRPAQLILRTCKHVLESGDFCQAAAMTGRTYCRAHVHLRIRLGKIARASRRSVVVKLPPLINLASVQDGMEKVRIALAEGRLDGHARLLRYALRQIAANLRFLDQLGGSVAAPNPPGKSKQVYQMQVTIFDS